MGLHKSLNNYSWLECYFRTKSYVVRIDNIDGDKKLRYASWKAPSDMSGQPDLIIMDGHYDNNEDTFFFTNNGYEYIVGYDENIPTSEGTHEHHEYLLIKKNGKVIFKEERINP